MTERKNPNTYDRKEKTKYICDRCTKGIKNSETENTS